MLSEHLQMSTGFTCVALLYSYSKPELELEVLKWIG